jgi:hypothetical protein
MKKTFKIYFILITLMPVFISCRNPSDLSMPVFMAEPGTGLLFLTIDRPETARTILPPTPQSKDFALFELKFYDTTTSVYTNEDRSYADLSDPVTLTAGTYNLEVTAYMDVGKTKTAAQGSVSGIEIPDGGSTAKTLTLTAINDNGEGTFIWEIEYPAVSFASMIITPLDAVGTPTQTIGGLAPFGKNDSLILNSGEYRVDFFLRDAKGQTAELKEILHVYQNLESTFRHAFNESNFHFLNVKKVVFAEQENTTVVTFDGLSGNDIYLVKVNTSGFVVDAAGTGNARAASPIFRNDGQTPSYTSAIEEFPRMGHPEAEKFNANPPPIARGQGPQRAPAQAVNFKIGDTRKFWLEEYFDNGKWEEKEATLLAQGTYSNIWGTGRIDSAKAQEVAKKFDVIYQAETNILGYEYGGGPAGDGGRDGDPRIQILFYPIVDPDGNVMAGGFFWGKDFYTQTEIDSEVPKWNVKTNNAEIFYVDASLPLLLVYTTLAHELQHMIHFNQKMIIKNNPESPTWYNEMLSSMTEDVMADIIGIRPSSGFHIIHQRMISFLGMSDGNGNYSRVGLTEWDGDYSYSMVFAFGAYLMRNFGGVKLLSRIVANDKIGIESVTSALDEFYPGLDFTQALARFGEAMLFTGLEQDGVLTFNKDITYALNGFTYNASGIDIWSGYWNGYGIYKPYIFDLTPKELRPHSLSVHSDNTWLNKTGTFSITLDKPDNSDVMLFLMVK